LPDYLAVNDCATSSTTNSLPSALSSAAGREWQVVVVGDDDVRRVFRGVRERKANSAAAAVAATSVERASPVESSEQDHHAEGGLRAVECRMTDR
jgi:hypothetical protein